MPNFRKHWKPICHNCGAPIITMVFQGTDHCSENCRKDLEKKNVQDGE